MNAGWEGESHWLDAEVIRAYVPEPDKCLFMMAGPPAMNDALALELEGMGVPTGRIRADHFLGYE